MNGLSRILPIGKDDEGNMPKLHFDIGKQTTSITKMYILGWVVSQRKDPSIGKLLDHLTRYHNPNDAFDAMESAAQKIYQRALEYSYNPLFDPKTQKLCKMIIKEEIQAVFSRNTPELAKIEAGQDVKTISDSLSDILRWTALTNTYVGMITGEIPKDAEQVKAMAKSAYEDFPESIQGLMKTALDKLDREMDL